MKPQVPDHCKKCGGECLKNVEFLIGLPPEKVATLLQRAERLHLKKGEYSAELPAPAEIVRLSHQTLSE